MRRSLPLLLAAAGSAVSCSSQSDSKPNVIVILGDDYSFGEHGIYGNEIIQTPNIDRFIAEGVSFDNFYVGPTSAPTRAQLMTGKHEFKGGITHTKYPRAYLNLNEKIMPEYFLEEGYTTAHFGKWHLGNDTFDDEYSARARGFESSIVSDYKVHFDPNLRVDGEMKSYKGFRTDILFDEAISWIITKSKEQKPLMCWIATNSAHMPFDCPQQYKDMYRGKLKTREAEDYYGMVTNMDDNIGRLIEQLKSNGLYEDTILIYMTDNGHVVNEYNAGMRGRKGSQYRGGTRVPFAIHYPTQIEGSRVINELAGGIDLLPTLLELCGIELDKEVDGVSLVPLIKGEREQLDDRFMVCHTGRWLDGAADSGKYNRYAVQNRRFRLVDNKALYDIESDPAEKINVIDQHPELVSSMRDYYEQWWTETRPLMINEERALYEGGSRLSIEDVEYRKDNQRDILDMVHHNPGEPLYQTKYNDPEVLREMGYNGKVYFLFDSPMLAINWESVDKNILPKGSVEREWVDNKAIRVSHLLDSCKMVGLSTWAMSDLILFPKRLIELYGIEQSFGDPQLPQIQKLLRAQIAEMFDQFPNLDGIVVRIGETYLHDAPYHVGKIDNKNSAEQTIIPLMELLREEICVKHNKRLIFRTWESFDRNLESYMEVSEAVEPHPNMTIGIKHCEGDFHRSNPFSRVIGQGRHRQIVEVQCAREYEGKGAYPNYVANGVIEGFEEHATMPEGSISSLREFAHTKPQLFAGIWTWTRGGGWEGPYINNELWCDLNAWVMAQWARTPQLSEEIIFNRYATQRLGLMGDDISKFRRLALLSTDAVIRGRNTVEGDMFTWWTRDEGIGWPQIKPKDNLERVLTQKDESIKMWQQIVELSESIKWSDKATRDHAISSCYYGLHLYEIYRAVVNIAVAEHRGDRASIDRWIKEYDRAWTKYNSLPSTYPNISTLYTQEYQQRYHRSHAHSEVERLRNLRDL